MRKIYLHIGVTKTGTTALQSFFSKSSDFLLDHGILYPNPDGDPINDQPWVGNAYTFAESLYSETYDKTEITKCVDSLARLAENEAKDILLSCEAFSSIKSLETVHFICDTISQHFEIVLLAYLRDPLSWAYSIWKQFVKGNCETRDFHSFMQAYPEQWPHCSAWLSYAETLHVFSYDKHKKDIRTPILQALGIDAAIRNESPTLAGLTTDNRSLSDSELAFFREFNTIDRLANAPNLRWDIFLAFLKRQPGPVQCTPPDPQYAAEAEAKHEALFQALAPHISREEIILGSRQPRTEEHNKIEQLNEEEVRIALSVIARNFAENTER